MYKHTFTQVFKVSKITNSDVMQLLNFLLCSLPSIPQLNLVVNTDQPHLCGESSSEIVQYHFTA